MKVPVIQKNGLIDFFNTKSVTLYKYSIDDVLFFLLIMLVCVPNLFAQYFDNNISTTICVTKIEKQQKYYIITALDGDEYVVIVSKHHKKTENSVKLRPNRCYTMCLIPYLKDNLVPTEGLRYTIRIDGDDVLVPLRGRNIYFVSNLFGLYLIPVTKEYLPNFSETHESLY